MKLRQFLKLNSRLFAIFLIAIQAYFTLALAQRIPDEGGQDSLQIVKRDKSAVLAEYKLQETACYQKFVANACVDIAKKNRNAALAQIKRREIALNYQQREVKKLNLDQRTAKLPSATVHDNLHQQPAKHKAGSTPNSKPSRESRAGDAKRESEAKKRVVKVNAKNKKAQYEAARRARKASLASGNAAKQAKKIEQARAHQTEINARNAQSTKPKAASLPVPAKIRSAQPQ